MNFAVMLMFVQFFMFLFCPQQPRPPIKPRASTSDISECDLNDNTLTDEEKRKLMKEKRKQKRKDRKQRQKAEKEASGILPPPPQPKSKLTKAPITLDIGNLFDKLLKVRFSAFFKLVCRK